MVVTGIDRLYPVDVPDKASTVLLGDTAPLWDAIRQHPIVQGIALGTIAPEQFDFWVEQDHHYVAGARRFVCVLLARANDQDTIEHLGHGLIALGEEMDAFSRYARERGFSIGPEPAPTTEAYVNFLINSAVNSFEVGFAVLFAEERACFDVWRHIRLTAGSNHPYRAWIDRWTSPEFAAYVSWIEATLNRQVEGWPERSLEPLRAAFRLAARYEYMFWEMVARRERWPF